MTAKELNRDIKRLFNKVKKATLDVSQKYGSIDDQEFSEMIEKDFKPEFKRLWLADKDMEYLNLNSVKMMFKMNNMFDFVSFNAMTSTLIEIK